MVLVVHVEDHLAVRGDAAARPRGPASMLATGTMAARLVAPHRRLADLDRTALHLQPDDPVVGHRSSSRRCRPATGSTWVGLGIARTCCRWRSGRRCPGRCVSTVIVPLSWLATYTRSPTTVRSRGMSPPQRSRRPAGWSARAPGRTATVSGPRLAISTIAAVVGAADPARRGRLAGDSVPALHVQQRRVAPVAGSSRSRAISPVSSPATATRSSVSATRCRGPNPAGSDGRRQPAPGVAAGRRRAGTPAIASHAEIHGQHQGLARRSGPCARAAPAAARGAGRIRCAAPARSARRATVGLDPMDGQAARRCSWRSPAPGRTGRRPGGRGARRRWAPSRAPRRPCPPRSSIS